MAEQNWDAIDGDSLQQGEGRSTRLLGINAPERAHSAGRETLPDMPGSRPATEALQQALDAGAQVRSTGEKGYYGRDLQRVTDDQGDVAADMAARGLADTDRTTSNALNRHWLNELNGDGPIRPEWDQQANDASRQRLQFIERRFGDLMATANDVKVRGVGVNPRTDTVGSAAGDALSRGTDQFQGSLFGFAEVIGGVTGIDPMERWGRDGMLTNLTEAAMKPARVESYEDVDGLATFGMYVLETVMEETPALGADIAAGLATGGSVTVLAGIGKAALRTHKAASAVGQAGKLSGQLYRRSFNTGLGASAFGQMVGETRQGQFQEGLADEDAANAYALGVGSAKAITEFVGVRKILDNVMRGADPDDVGTILGLAKEAKDVRSFMGALGRGAELGAGAGFTEGLTELSQSLMDQFGNMGLDPDQQVAFENLDPHELIESTLRGTTFGGAVGTAGATGAGIIGAAQNRDRLDQEQQQAENGVINSGAPTDAEPVSDLVTQIRSNGRVWMSRGQTGADADAVIHAATRDGLKVYARQNDDGDTLITTNPDDPLLSDDVELSGKEYARSNGYTPKEELNTDEPLYAVQARDPDGNVITEAVTDETNLTRTAEAVQRNAPDGQVSVTTPEEVVADRRARLAQQNDDLSGLTAEAPEATQPAAPELIVGPKLGQYETDAAAEVAGQQAERSIPTTESQRGSASVYREGRLRPVGELVADFRAQRLDRKQLTQVLRARGINPARFESNRPVIDEATTREAIRRKLMADRKLAAKFADNLTYGKPFELADVAMRSLEEGDTAGLLRAAKQVGVEAQVPRVPKDDQAERVLRGRVRSRLSGKMPRDVKRRLAEQYLGSPDQTDGLPAFARSLEKEQLVQFADLAGARVDDATQPTEAALSNAVAMFRALAEQGSTRPTRPTPKATPTPNQQAQQSRAGQPSTYQQVRESFDWLFDGDGQPIEGKVVIEQQGGRAQAKARLRETVSAAMEQNPALGDEVQRHMDRRLARGRNTQEEALIGALQRTFLGMDADPEPVGQDSSAVRDHQQRMGEAVRDMAVMAQWAGRVGVSLDMGQLRTRYWQYTSMVSADAPVARLSEELAAMEKASEETNAEQTEQLLAQQWALENDRDPDDLIAGLEVAAASNPTDPEGAVLDALVIDGLIGATASMRLATARTTRPEAGTTANVPSRARESNPDDKAFEDAYSPQEQSDRLFYRILNAASLKLPRFYTPQSERQDPSNYIAEEQSFQAARHAVLTQPRRVYEQRQSESGALRELAGIYPRLIFSNGITDHNASQLSQAADHTKQANGLNLLMLRFQSATNPNGQYEQFVDAITLAKYRKGGEPSTLGEALENLEDNLARLAQGPESDLPFARIMVIPPIPDDMVVWQDRNGRQFTAGEARTERDKGLTDRNRVADAAAQRDALSQELEQLDESIDLTLEQMQDEAAMRGDADVSSRINDIWQLKGRIVDERTDPAHLRGLQRQTTQIIRDLGTQAAFDFGDGVLGTLDNAVAKRFDLLRQLKQRNATVASESGAMRTSLSGEKALETALAREGNPEIDEEGFDQQMAQGNDARQMENTAYEERRDASENLEGYQDMLGRPDDEGVTNEEWDQDQSGELTEQEVEVYAQQIAYGESSFGKKPSTLRGFQIDVAPRPKARAEARPTPQAQKRTGVSRTGKAANRRDFQALEAFTRRMMALVSRGQTGDGPRFSHTSVTLIETGDQAALEQLAQEAGHTAPPAALRSLFYGPGYLNLHGRVVIAMDPKPPRGSRAEWLLTYGHELGHLFYDQSWHQLPQTERGAIQQEFVRETSGDYNGKTGLAAFKEWFADKMSAAIAEDVTQTRRGEYLGTSGPLGKALRLIIDRLQKLWQAIQQDKAVRRLARFKQNDTFAKFARRVLRGEVQLRHRHETDTLETLHYTPDEQPMSPRATAARAKKAAWDPTVHAAGALARSVIGRIRGYNEELGDSLFQASNRSRAGTGSYEQKRYALHSRYQSWMAQAFRQIEPRRRKQEAAVDRAYADLRDGRDTPGARVLRKITDQVIRDARKSGWRTTQGFTEGALPRAYNHKAMEARRGEFFAMAQEALPNVSAEDINKRMDRIIDGFGLEDLEHEPMGPGHAVGTHDEAALLMDAIGTDRLAEAGFLQDKGTGILHHFAAGLSKRTAWESSMGGFVDRDGNYTPEASERMARVGQRTGQPPLFDPNARYKYLLAQVKSEHGDNAEREVRNLVSGALGHNNLGVNQKVRATQEWITGISNMMILGFSGVMSIPELALAPVRAGFNPKEILEGFSNYREAREFAYDIGVVMTSGAEQIARETVGEGYQSNMLSKASNVFFTANGQQFITRLSRTWGTAIGMRFVLKAARDGDYRSLEKLGLTPQDVTTWNSAGRPAFTADMEGEIGEASRKVSEGVAQFVSDGTLNPNKFQGTGWGNNPYTKLLWQLKQFLWTMGDTVIAGTFRRAKEQYEKGKAQGYTAPMSVAMASLPVMNLMALSLPLVYVSLALRGLLAGDEEEPLEDQDGVEKIVEMTRRAGFFAQWEMLHGVYRAWQWDQGMERIGGVAGALMPSVSVARDIIETKDDWSFDAEKSAENLKDYVPLASQWKGTWQWMF